MQNTTATFTITHDAGEVRSIAINMPFEKWNVFGELWISLPLICTETNVGNEMEIHRTIRNCLVGDCRLDEEMGMGIERELQAIGWQTVRKNAGVLMMECPASETDTMIEMAVTPATPLFIPSLITREKTFA